MPEFNYERDQIQRVLDGGTTDGDFRLKVTGHEKSKWLKVTHDQMRAIQDILAPADNTDSVKSPPTTEGRQRVPSYGWHDTISRIETSLMVMDQDDRNDAIEALRSRFEELYDRDEYPATPEGFAAAQAEADRMAAEENARIAAARAAAEYPVQPGVTTAETFAEGVAAMDRALARRTQTLKPYRVLFENGEEANVMAFDRDDAERRTNTPERGRAHSVIDLIENPDPSTSSD